MFIMIKKSLKLVVLVVFCFCTYQSVTLIANEDELKASTESASPGVLEENKTEVTANEVPIENADKKEKKIPQTVQIPWHNPLFKNTTLLNIYYVKVEFETPTGKSFAEIGDKDPSNVKSYIGKDEEKRLKGKLVFDVDLDPDSVNTTKINVLIKAIGKGNSKYKIQAFEEYSNKLLESGNSGKFWSSTKEFTSNSHSNIKLLFDEETIKFKLEGNFSNIEKNLGKHKYGFSMFMRCLKGGREIIGL